MDCALREIIKYVEALEQGPLEQPVTEDSLSGIQAQGGTVKKNRSHQPPFSLNSVK